MYDVDHISYCDRREDYRARLARQRAEQREPAGRGPAEAELAAALAERDELRRRVAELERLVGARQATAAETPAPAEPCPGCGSRHTRMAAGAGPHYAALMCAACGQWLRWVPRPRKGGV